MNVIRSGKTIFHDTGITFIILLVSFFICLFLNHIIDAQTIIPAVFSLAVFLISRYTDGYRYGIAASVISVLAVNYVFTFPYMAFAFTIFDDIVTTCVMLVITLMTSALITQIKHHEQMRIDIEKEKMRANLLRAVSHDLRTPLTTIYGSCDVLLNDKQKLSESQKNELLYGIQEDAQWLIRMVENLLSVTRMDEQNGVFLQKMPIVLEELIDTTISKFHRRYPDCPIDVQLPTDLIIIPMDPVLIEQVLVNFLDNACLHAAGMTRLILAVEKHRQTVRFEVKDDGCGIPSGSLSSLFNGTITNNSSNVDHTRGMGIGLTACASIIHAHGGTIGAHNRKSGGSCFWFTLELDEEE